jgi:hypothetical protein
MDNVEACILGLAMLVVAAFAVAFAHDVTLGACRQEAIAHHAAHHDAVTGKFTWDKAE